MGGKSAAQRVPRTPAMPLGAKYDPSLTPQENARVAWEFALARINVQSERGFKLALRHAFALEETPDFTYYERWPRIPFVEIGDDLVSYEDQTLCLVEFCGDCGKEYKRRGFRSLDGFGEVLSQREADEPYVCRDCQFNASAKSFLGRKKAA